MGCEQWWGILSAQLDGEATAAEQAGAEAHLAGCAGCRDWLDRAAAITRRARLTSVAPAPGLADRVLAALPAAEPAARDRSARVRSARDRFARLRSARDRSDRLRSTRLCERVVLTLRGLLGLLGVLQLVLGLVQAGTPTGGQHTGTLTPGHLWHESAAWNVAVGAGFLFVAVRRTPPAGLVPMLTAFVGTLALLSANDLITGRVGVARLVSHGFLLAGYAVVVALSRPRLHPDGPPASGRGNGPGWRLSAQEPAEPAPAELRLVRYPGSARRRDDWAA
ncbi:zf-HC2 domain-containing protein [Plantactinospora sp. KBS50]|uniref:zf-HC2 domain-containing protein n=1 Tax=Plantactinospora sp. KBS50 TaxID=2024580 RepID=UPI000BAABC93|nr:zf-HC2 domain-containing protein [Plantactinospora sp. KBS50]ASW54835.1 hypothetical protein CIK06_12540 [Plantactinospora sp. KBS50]